MIEERLLREAEGIAIELNRLQDGDDFRAFEERLDQAGRFLQYVGKRWTRRNDPHDERRCALRRALGRPCSCPMGCRCPQAGCGEDLGHMLRSALPIYGESSSERRARVLRRSSQFGHWLTKERPGLAYEIDGVRDPFRVSVLEAEEIASSHEYDGHDWQDLPLARSVFLGDVMNAPTEHSCGVRPITPWPTSGGVYFVRRRLSLEEIKIGVAQNVRHRLQTHQAMEARPLELLAVEPGGRGRESELHKRWSEYRIDEGGGREWFVFVPEIARHVLSLREASA